jgi:two-component system catabolic regulation response regulator CreB
MDSRNAPGEKTVMDKQTILIIEDETAIADAIIFPLELEGFLPVRAATGGEGLRLLAEQPPALIILDLGLPDISGIELLKRIRGGGEIPVLILTARREEIDRILGLELGADDYVTKPFSPRELTARVKTILRRSNRPATPAGPAGPFAVDREKHRISYCGTLLDLSRYEYGILSLLVSRPGWILSREQIMDAVWEQPEESFDRTVDAHIKTLRAKLKAVNPEDEPILTRRGIGYSMKEYK